MLASRHANMRAGIADKRLLPHPILFRRHPFLIGVAGGTASGKTTVCDRIMQRLNDQCVVMLSQVGAPQRNSQTLIFEPAPTSDTPDLCTYAYSQTISRQNRTVRRTLIALAL